MSSTKQHIFMLSKLAKLEFESKNWANAIQITKQRLDLAPENEIEVQALAHADLIALYQETGEKVRVLLNTLLKIKYRKNGWNIFKNWKTCKKRMQMSHGFTRQNMPIT